MTKEPEYPSAIATVDIIPLCYSRKTRSYEILLGRKEKHGGKLCFIGGFVDAELDNSFYDAAVREVREEVSTLLLTTGTQGLKYLYSKRVDDPRYRDKKAKIFTSFFLLETHKQNHEAGDDLDEVLWRDLDLLISNPEILVDEHAKLIRDLSMEIKWRMQNE